MPTDGFDIKVYTVGPDYAHAGFYLILIFTYILIFIKFL